MGHAVWIINLLLLLCLVFYGVVVVKLRNQKTYTTVDSTMKQ